MSASLESVMAFWGGIAGSQFFWILGARSDEYRESSSDEGQRSRPWKWKNGCPRPFGLRRYAVHTSLSPLAADPPQPSDSVSSGPLFARNDNRPKGITDSSTSSIRATFCTGRASHLEIAHVIQIIAVKKMNHTA